ncbi:MAG: AEC family transporter, partial [Kiritimatiellaeota bacterium]|nr:AEC family transporter [Kiritimatiellota bacterium]
KIAVMFLVMLAGWAVRRHGSFTSETTNRLGRLVVDVTFPALVFTQMLQTVTAATLRASLCLPLAAIGVMSIAAGVGWTAARLVRAPAARPTFVFLVATPNWIYLPLPIMLALFGPDGVRAVLLFNVGAQIFLWTAGVALLCGGFDQRAVRQLPLNPGLLATAAGIALALLYPGAAGLETAQPGTAAAGELVCAAVVQALWLLGSLTIPLSLLVTGAQLGDLRWDDPGHRGLLAGVVALRLLAAPAATLLLLRLLALLGWPLPDVARYTIVIIAAMPVALNCSLFTERFGGDTRLSASGIFLSTLGSLVTVPACYGLMRWLGW